MQAGLMLAHLPTPLERAPTSSCLNAMHITARTEGLLLDPVYSGKAMAGVLALSESGLEAKAIDFLATGGVPGLFESRFEAWIAGAER